jgi:diadenosine tetraphosphate (Ap4A) HIT family hydrolase
MTVRDLAATAEEPRLFELHPRLVAATAPIGELPLSAVRLLDDHRLPWILLVPRRPGVEEIFELAPADRAQLMEETSSTAEAMKRRFRPVRLNIADIGNRAPQLHVHVVARFEDDPFWPAVAWSRERAAYEPAAREARRREMAEAFAALAGFTPAE